MFAVVNNFRCEVQANNSFTLYRHLSSVCIVKVSCDVEMVSLTFCEDYWMAMSDCLVSLSNIIKSWI